MASKTVPERLKMHKKLSIITVGPIYIKTKLVIDRAEDKLYIAQLPGRNSSLYMVHENK